MSGQDSYLDQAKKMAGDAVNYASETAKSAQDTIMGKVSRCLRIASLPAFAAAVTVMLWLVYTPG